MPDELISVAEFAGQLGKRKQTLFKVIRRLRIEPQKLRNSDRRGQRLSYITVDESRLIAAELRVNSETHDTGATASAAASSLGEQGVFYLLELEPEHDPGRFKVGFAVSMPERLRTLRCSAPFTTVVRTWPCKLLREKTAIDSVTQGCDQLHTEVFRTESIEPVVQRCDQFFSLMPGLKNSK